MPQATTATTVDEYIAGFPPEVGARLAEVRQIVHQFVPGVGEKISYAVTIPVSWSSGWSTGTSATEPSNGALDTWGWPGLRVRRAERGRTGPSVSAKARTTSPSWSRASGSRPRISAGKRARAGQGHGYLASVGNRLDCRVARAAPEAISLQAVLSCLHLTPGHLDHPALGRRHRSPPSAGHQSRPRLPRPQAELLRRQ